MVKLIWLFLLLLLVFDDEVIITCSSLSPNSSSLPSSNVVHHHLCISHEKAALLQFKRLFVVLNASTARCSINNYAKIESWKEEVHSGANRTAGDCCSWEGVECDRSTGHVIGLYLRCSRLQGTIPPDSSLFQLSHLRKLNLGGNDFNSSNISSAFGLSFPHLTHLDLSHSDFSGWIPPEIAHLSQLIYLDITPGNSVPLRLEPQAFKMMIKNLTQLEILYLSGVNISSSIPEYIGNITSLTRIRFSGNGLYGKLPQIMFQLPNLQELQLSHNEGLFGFTSHIPVTVESISFVNLTKLRYLDLSHNKLHGDIPPSFCDSSMLDIIDLSHNNLSGVIPKCIGNFSSALSVLNLGTNSFHGTIPSNFAKGNLIRSINLNDNHLEGQVPQSLINCRNLEVLDLGNNIIADMFPYWLYSLPELQVLVLHHNKFHGFLGLSKTKKVHPFLKLRILDLSHNEFSGPLPTNYFLSFSAMRDVNRTQTSLEYMGNSYYVDTVVITWKGVVFDFQRILKTLATIDLSCNKFEGDIPNAIGSLVGIQSLNLSNNALSGHIPLSLENLSLLESLDLSSNQLSGVIPQELAHVTTLAVLNLSSNHLVGPIPRGFQFDTFQNESYRGNLGLCGLPLSKKCSDNEAPPQEDDEEEEEEGLFDGFGWKDVLLGYGCGLAFGLSVGVVMFSTGKPKRLVIFVEEELLRMAKRTRKRRGQGNRNGRRRG